MLICHRAISYYYQRCYDVEACVGYKKRINDLTVEDLEFIAIYDRQGKHKEDNKTVVILDEGLVCLRVKMRFLEINCSNIHLVIIIYYTK